MHGSAFELLQPRHRKPPVARPRSDHHGPGPHHFSRFQLDAKRGGVARQPHGLVGNGEFDAELLRLRVGARHQRHSGNAGGEPEIILDARRCARLTAERPAIEHQHRQALRSRIDCRRQPGRSRPDNGHVIGPVLVDRTDQPQAPGERGFAGVVEDLAAGAKHQRQLLRLDFELRDQRPCAFVARRVEHLVGMAVAPQEIHQPQYLRIAFPADDDRPAAAAFDQADPA